MAVLLFAVELNVLNELAAPDRDKIMLEVAEAYKDRGRLLANLGRSEAAARDRKRAAQLEADARQLADAAKMGQLELINRWNQPISIIIDGVAIQLAVGETKRVPKPAGTFRYELPSTGQVSTGQVEAGKTFAIQIR